MIRSLDAPTRRLYILFLAGFIAFGAIFTIAGAGLPQIIRTFGWSYAVTGAVLSASALGYLVSTFLSGILLARVPARAVLVTALGIGALSWSLFGRWASPWLNFYLYFGSGICMGGIEVVANLEIIHMERNGQSRLMNLLHAAFCVGAVVGPASMGFLTRTGLSILSVFSVTAGFLAVMAILFSVIRFPRVRPEPGHEEAQGLRLLRQPVLLLLTLVLLLYVGVEIGVSSWSSEYFVKVLGASPSTGAFAVALFWTGLLAGRLGISVGYRGTRQELVMLVLAVLSSAGLVLLLLARSVPAVAGAVVLAGLGCSGFYPLAISVVGRYYKSGVAIGTAVTGGAAGSVAFPFLMALLSQSVGMRGGFWFYLALSLVLVGLTGALARQVRPGRQDRG